MEHAVWKSSVYEPFEELLQKKDDSVETTVVDGKKYQVITIESAPIVMSTSLYTKIYGKCRRMTFCYMWNVTIRT